MQIDKVQIRDSSHRRVLKKRAYLSSDPHCLLDMLIKNYLLALPPLQKKWILVPHLSWKTWIEQQITHQIGILTSCEITTPDALITSFSKVREAILSPSEIALLSSSFKAPLADFFGHTPTYPEVQKLGKLLFELGYLSESQLPLCLKENPSLLFLYQQLYAGKTPFAPWIRKLSNPLSLQTSIALFQIPELPSSFLSAFEGDLITFCLEPSPHFWADELTLNPNGTPSLLPDLFMQFGQVRKRRMKQILDSDMEIHEEFSESDSNIPLVSLRSGLSELDDEQILQGLQKSFTSSSLQIALLGSPLEEVRFVATMIEQKIHALIKEHSSTKGSLFSRLSTLLDEILIVSPPGQKEVYASLFEVEFARVQPTIPALFDTISSDPTTFLMHCWLSLLSPTGDGKISPLINSFAFFELFEMEKSSHSSFSSILTLFTQKEEKSSRKASDNPIQDKIELIQFLITELENHLFSYQGDEELAEQFLTKLLHLSSSLAPWQTFLLENQSKTLGEWHAIFDQTAEIFFEKTLPFENPLSALVDKSKHQWMIPIDCHALLNFCRIRDRASSSSMRGILHVRPFSYSCITPSKTIFLLGMGPEYAGLHEQVFPWLLSKERLAAKTPPIALEKDTLFDLLLVGKEELIITSSKEESLKEAPLVRTLLSSAQSSLTDVLGKPSCLTKSSPASFKRENSSPLNSRDEVATSSAQTPKTSIIPTVIDLSDLLSFAENPLRYSLKKHLSSLSYCPDRKKQIDEEFAGKTIKSSEILKFSNEKLIQKKKQLEQYAISKKGLLGAAAGHKIAPLLEVQPFIQEGRFDAHLTPLQDFPAWHSSSLFLHPPFVGHEESFELRGLIEGLHQEGILLVKSDDASSTLKEKIEKWPLLLIQSLLFHHNPNLLKRPRWMVLPSLAIRPCKTDLHPLERFGLSLNGLVTLYQKAQTIPCLYTPEWIIATLEKGTALMELFTSEIEALLQPNSFGTPGNGRSLAMAYAAEKEWFEKALSYDFTEDLQTIYSPLFSIAGETQT